MNVAEKERLSVANDDDLTFGKTMVVKSGKTTGRRIGVYIHGIFSVKVDESFLSRVIFGIL